MEILKTKDAAELLSVSQTTIKRWAAMFPDFFQRTDLATILFQSSKSACSHILKNVLITENHWKVFNYLSRMKFKYPSHRKIHYIPQTLSLCKIYCPGFIILNAPLIKKPTK